ncbi:uncharacterized protein LOC109860628 [Pseudomyrmex gracilis]|uniref:uncharacterized protein LOC109860628 n=1 Tax=Pseudomyrmex gracilis TaxID=219809 RepID=UPI0009958E0E|nr:uncharacterized protein LOC109860628 [Pseudomyrmex gracilis]
MNPAQRSLLPMPLVVAIVDVAVVVALLVQPQVRQPGIDPRFLEPKVEIREGDKLLPQDTWAVVARRNRGRSGSRQAAPKVALPQERNAFPPPQPCRQRSQSRRRPIRTAAVTLTCVGDGLTTAAALREIRQNITLADIGIEKTSIRRSQTGEIVIANPGPDGHTKADELAARMRTVLEKHKEDVRIGRPMQMAELRLFGIEDSVDESEVQTAVALATGCDRAAVQVGLFRLTRSLDTAWVKCPLVAANALVRKGRLRLRWSMARVKLLKARGLQCFRCLQFGHTRLKCTALADRSKQCYNCGEEGH